MFTFRNIEETDERGSLLLEAIALLGLMTMMSPMVVRQTAERSSEIEAVSVAGQIKEIKDALHNYIVSNYLSLAHSANDADDYQKNITASDLSPYLPESLLSGANFRGNKMIDDYKIGVRAQCTDKSNGKCLRYKMTGVVVSDIASEIDDRRASRIASMIGADGGYTRTMTMLNALNQNNDDGKKKILGSQGIWLFLVI